MKGLISAIYAPVRRFCNSFASFCVLVIVVLSMALVAKMAFEFLSPVITILFVAFFTIAAFERWTTAVASIVGIILYFMA
jgi:hypothetical protein